MERQNISTNAKWETIVGYSRGVRVGSLIEVSGTVAQKDGKVVAKGDAYGQTTYIIEIVADCLEKAGASLKDVIRTRMYVTDISQWEQIGKAHGEAFESIKPATSMVEVRSLIDPDYLVEMEVTAMISD